MLKMREGVIYILQTKVSDGARTSNPLANLRDPISLTGGFTLSTSFHALLIVRPPPQLFQYTTILNPSGLSSRHRSCRCDLSVRRGGFSPVWLLTKALPQIVLVANQTTST